MRYVRLKCLVEAYQHETNWIFQFVKLLSRQGYVNFADYDMAVDVFVVARECGHDVVFAEWHDTTTDGLPIATYSVVKRKLKMRKPERPQSPRHRFWKDVDDIPDEIIERIADDIMRR